MRDISRSSDNGWDVVLGIDAELLQPGNSGAHNVVYIPGSYKPQVVNGVTHYQFEVQSWGDKYKVDATSDQILKYLNEATYGKD